MSLLITRREVIFALVYLIHFLVLFNAVLVKLGISYAYIALMLVMVSTLLIFGLNKEYCKRYSFHAIYIFVLTTLACSHIVFLNVDQSALISLGLYLSPIICWLLVFSKYERDDYEILYKSTYKLSVLVATLGIVQYFLSPGLFGFIPTDSMAIKWALDKSFAEYAIFFRATSTLGSPQVFGLYCALQLIIADRFRHLFKSRDYWIGFGIFSVGGLLSGNKSFFVIVIGYFLLRNVSKVLLSAKTFVLSALLMTFVVVSSISLLDKVPMLERVFSLDSIVEQEQDDSRLSRYKYILDNTDIMTGNGLGSITNKRHNELRAAESYIFKVYYEAGVWGLVSLLGVLISSFFMALLRTYSDFLIVFFIFISMIVVHAFESPAFFVVWGYLLSLFARNSSEKFNEVSGAQ